MCKSTPISYSENILVLFFYYNIMLLYILAGIEKHYLLLRLTFRDLKTFNC